ncbi:Short-chain dehydrogenase [Operophtera brumata]|uniref:Short-chain dehydrogenase n=1 Tax=Operophtera brumata TaxID=104452 RepID=A0A0L7LUF3_OPEBR|nr:Short-chain dehydrogenase [Operophtera brumata]
MDVINFTEKVVIVTGASSGIGAASAILFAKYGAKLALIGRDEERLKATSDKCHQAYGLQPLCIKLDLTDSGACEQAVKMTVDTYGQIDVLVNSAGKLVLGSLFDNTVDTFDEMIEINLRVPYKMTHTALPYLVKTKGNIVNLASTQHNKTRHGFLPLSVAKCGLNKFTKMAAFELASVGVRVNSVNPGLTRTNILSNLAMTDEEIITTYEGLSTDCNMKVLEPEEIAKMIV